MIMKELPSLPVDPFTFHQPYFHQTTKEFAFSAWYVIMLTGTLVPDQTHNQTDFIQPEINVTRTEIESPSNQTSKVKDQLTSSMVNLTSNMVNLTRKEISQPQTNLSLDHGAQPTFHKEAFRVPPNITQKDLVRNILGALSKSFNSSSALFHVNSVRSGAEGTFLNFSLNKPSLPSFHRRLLSMKELRMGKQVVEVRVHGGRVEHIYINREHTDEGNKTLVFVSFSLGLIGLILTVLMLAYFGAKILQKAEEDEKFLVNQEYDTEEQSQDNPEETYKFLNNDISYIELDSTSLTRQEEEPLTFDRLHGFDHLQNQLQEECLKKVGL